MAGGDSFDRVSKFLDKIGELSPQEIENQARRIESDIYELFKRLERLHSLSDGFQQVDLSEDIYALLRIMERQQVVRRFPLLSRAAGLL